MLITYVKRKPVPLPSQTNDDIVSAVAPTQRDEVVTLPFGIPWVQQYGKLQFDGTDTLPFGVATVVDDSDDNVQPYVVWSAVGSGNVILATDDSHGVQLTNFYLDEYVYTPQKPWVELYGHVYIYTDESRIAQAADGLYVIELNIVPSADGVVTLRVRPINAATSVMVRQGSLGFMQEV